MKLFSARSPGEGCQRKPSNPGNSSKFDRCRSVRRSLTVMVFAAITLTLVSSSSATPLVPGGILYPAPLGASNLGSLIATNVVPFTSPTYTGILTSEVFQGDATNPLGGLTFVYQIQNTSPFPGEINRLTVNSFAGFATNAVYSNASGVLAPGYIDRSIGTGETIGFSFAEIPLGFGSLQPTDTSDLLIVYTNASSFAATLASVIDGSVAQVPSFAPTSVIPEPGTMLLATLGGLGLFVLGKRRQ
jgi:hypothetical protein